MNKIAVILTFVLSAQYLFAQNFEVGAEFSYGKTLVDSYFQLKDIFNEEPSNYFNFGFTSSYNPHKSVLFVNSGLLYHRVFDQYFSFNFIKLPIGIDLAFGKRLKIFFGGGANLNWLFLTDWNYSSVEPEFKKLQIGLYCDLGLKYQIVRNWSIYLKSQMDFDQSNLYYYDEGIEYRTYDYGATIGFKYLIPSKTIK